MNNKRFRGTAHWTLSPYSAALPDSGIKLRRRAAWRIRCREMVFKKKQEE